MEYEPPYSITGRAITAMAEIERLLGSADPTGMTRPEPQLRRRNRILTIKESLAIEGNTLNFDQATAIFNNNRVIGPKNEILEVKNAIATYAKAGSYKAGNEKDFKAAHGLMMQGLIASAGRYRAGAVGIMKGSRVSHMAPPAKRVGELMHNLFAYVRGKKAPPPLILSALMHYEIEFIHPFDDGNGRIGRLWQHVVLRSYHPLFEYAPFESEIRKRQKEYYRALELSDKSGDATRFIEFSLDSVRTALKGLIHDMPRRRGTAEERLYAAREKFSGKWFSRREYLALFSQISLPTASRDLAAGVREDILRSKGEKNQTEYRFA